MDEPTTGPMKGDPDLAVENGYGAEWICELRARVRALQARVEQLERERDALRYLVGDLEEALSDNKGWRKELSNDNSLLESAYLALDGEPSPNDIAFVRRALRTILSRVAGELKR